jgi:hypothetical protein
MSRRSSIIKALAERLKEIDGTGQFKTNLYSNAFPYLKFWDEVSNFPSIYLSPGGETRDYLPGGFKWGYLAVSVKAYVKGDDPQQQLEGLLEDIENVIDSTETRQMLYDTDNGSSTTEMTITSITTDEGLLAPYGVGEINIQVRYQIM